MRAAESPAELLCGNPRTCGMAGKQQYIVDISDSLSIFFCANHRTLPVNHNGCIDWSKIYRIKILNIGERDAE